MLTTLLNVVTRLSGSTTELFNNFGACGALPSSSMRLTGTGSEALPRDAHKTKAKMDKRRLFISRNQQANGFFIKISVGNPFKLNPCARLRTLSLSRLELHFSRSFVDPRFHLT